MKLLNCKDISLFAGIIFNLKTVTTTTATAVEQSSEQAKMDEPFVTLKILADEFEGTAPIDYTMLLSDPFQQHVCEIYQAFSQKYQRSFNSEPDFYGLFVNPATVGQSLRTSIFQEDSIRVGSTGNEDESQVEIRTYVKASKAKAKSRFRFSLGAIGLSGKSHRHIKHPSPNSGAQSDDSPPPSPAPPADLSLTDSPLTRESYGRRGRTASIDLTSAISALDFSKTNGFFLVNSKCPGDYGLVQGSTVHFRNRVNTSSSKSSSVLSSSISSASVPSSPSTAPPSPSSSSSSSSKSSLIRIFDANGSYKTLFLPEDVPARIICREVSLAFGVLDYSHYGLFLQKNGLETLLGDESTPIKLINSIASSNEEASRMIFQLAPTKSSKKSEEDTSGSSEKLIEEALCGSPKAELNLSFLSKISFPESFKKLSHLKKLVINNTNLGSLPSLTHIENLQILSLVKNKFDCFPEEILELLTLYELDLGNNQLAAIPPDISRLSNLTEIYLYVNRLQDISVLGSLNQLEVINVANNDLESIDFQHFSSLTSLSQLKIASNYLTTLSDEINQFKFLVDLNISRNQLTTLPESIGSLYHLSWFNCHHNQLTSLPATFSNLRDLQEVNLSSNRLTSLVHLDFPRLKNLNASYNCLKQLSSSISLPQLEEIDLSNNELISLPDSISEMSKVAKICLGYNHLTTLPDSLTSIKNLQHVDLKHNRLVSLPENIGSIGIKLLDLSSNQLHFLPRNLLSSRALIFLRIFNNPIKTLPISSGILNLPLQHLFLGDAELLPTSDALTHIAEFSKLRSLDVGYNHLKSIPNDMAHLTNLHILFLAGNSIKEIPTAIAKLSSLKELYLNSNQITSLPSSLKKLKSLCVLNLAFNSLKDASPLAKLSTLEWLDLSANKKLRTVPLAAFEKFAKLSVCYLEDTDILRKMMDSPEHGLPPYFRRKTHLCQKEGKRFLVSSADMIGRRSSMEDAMIIHGAVANNPEVDLFGIFDGHGGRTVAEFSAMEVFSCVKEFVTSIAFSENSQSPQEMLDMSFHSVQKAILNAEIGILEGATAAVCLIHRDTLYFANAGDSRIVMSHSGKAMRMTCDHKPNDVEEEKRIRDAGGFVNDDNRVNGILALSRAFGDTALSDCVTIQPFLNQYRLSVSQSDEGPREEFLILACDGLWDVFSDQEAVDLVHKHCSGPLQRQAAASVLRDHAFMNGSQDNISVIVVFF